MKDKQKENARIIKYIRYVQTRVILGKMDRLVMSTNQYKFYYDLCEYIKGFCKNHIMWYYFTADKFTVKKGARLIGCNTHTFMIMMERQKRNFIKKIEKVEEILLEKYEIPEMQYKEHRL